MKNDIAIDGHKMQYHQERVMDWKAGFGEFIYPIYVEISPVGHCNHRCTFCAVDYIGYKNRALDTGQLKNSIEVMAKGGVKSIMYAGEGEPMLHPDISQIANFTFEHGIDVAFTTNGTAMTQKFLDSCLPSITWIKVSINAGTEETYAKIHRTNPKHWNLVWDNLSRAIQERDRQALKTTIGVQSVLLPDNSETIEPLARKCISAGVDYLVVKPYSHNPNSETRDYKDIKYGETYTEMLGKLKSSFNSSNFEILTRESTMQSWDSQDRGYDTCHSTPYFWAYIMASGDVYACSAHIGDDSFLLGNIHESRFDSIWMGEKRKRLIEQMKTLDISKCRKNCRMNQVNKYLWDVKNPVEHRNFI